MTWRDGRLVERHDRTGAKQAKPEVIVHGQVLSFVEQAEGVEQMSRGNLIDQLYKKVSRPQLVDPVFIIGHPIDLSPLARKNDELTKKFNSLVFPGTQGGPLMHVIAAKAVAFKEAMEGIRNTQAAGIKVGLRFTINRFNAEEVPKVFDLLEEMDIPRVCFYHLVYAGRGSQLVRVVVQQQVHWGQE